MTTRGSISALRRPVVRAGAATVLFALAWSFLYVGPFAHQYHRLTSDLGLYQGYGSAVRHGEVPYRDFRIVYPPGALPVFVVPAWATGYAAVFALLMLVCGLMTAFLVGLVGAGWPAVVFVGVSPFLLGDLLRARYDLWPAVLATGVMAALLRGRHRLGWALLGAAISAKGYAIVLVPLATVWTARRAGRGELRRAAAWGAGVLAVTVLPFVAVSPHGMWLLVWEQIERPLQIESLGGAILKNLHRAVVQSSYGSANIVGEPARALAATLDVTLALALVWCWLRFARGNPEAERLCRYAAACLAAFVAFGKVLSPQYLIWLVPAVALVRGRRGLWAMGLLGAACLLMYAWIPDRYSEYKDGYAWSWAVLGRDLILVALFLVLAWPTGGSTLVQRGVWRRRPAGQIGGRSKKPSLRRD